MCRPAVLLSTLCYLGIVLNSIYRVDGWGSGSGSGSGSGDPLFQPVFMNCPVTALNGTLTAAVGTSQLNISGMGWPTAPGSSVSASVTTQLLPVSSDSVVIQTFLSSSGDSLMVTVVDQYGELSSTNTIILSVSLVATNDHMVQSQPCNFTVEIGVQDPAVCNNIQSVQPVMPPATVQQLYSITLIVGISISNFTTNLQLRLLQIQEVTANAMTMYCSANCGQCSMESSCAVFLRVCSKFSTDDIIVADVQPQTSEGGGRVTRNVASGDGTVVTFFVRLPDGAPGTSSIPFISAPTVQQVSAQSVSTYEAVLGAPIIGTPEVLVTSPELVVIQEIAVIVVPILVILAVATLVVGIVIILVVVYLKKGKKTAKVQPVDHSNPTIITNSLANKESV